MDVSIEKNRFNQCNFCYNKVGEKEEVITFVRSGGSGFKAYMCADCLEELNSKYHQLINDKK